MEGNPYSEFPSHGRHSVEGFTYCDRSDYCAVSIHSLLPRGRVFLSPCDVRLDYVIRCNQQEVGGSDSGPVPSQGHKK